MALLEGKIALITGAASGIGRATAERLAAEGASVVALDIDEANGKQVAEKIGGEFHAADVGDAGRWSEVVADVSARHGGIDIAYLNAGIPTHPPTPNDPGLMAAFDMATLSDAAYRRIMSVNVDGVVFGARAVLPAMAARGGGAIVATASVAGLIAFAQDPIYTLTKHAVVGLTRSLAPLLAPQGITLNAICPGVVDTNILGPGTAQRARDAGIPVIAPEQIAEAVLKAVTSGETGGLWVCLAEQDSWRYEFRPIEGIGI